MIAHPDGTKDKVDTVISVCAQEKQGVVTADGKLLPPRWVIKDMLWQSMLALV